LRPFCVLLAACYSPTPPVGVPCTSDRDCPSPQTCQSNRTCDTSCVDCEVDCWDSWIAGTITFEVPTRIEELRIDGTSSSNPSISSDGLTIYFERSNHQLRATRATCDALFDPPQPVSELQTSARDSRISTTADDNLAVFASSRSGTAGDLDLWQATRPSAGAPFSNVTSNPFPTIDDINAQFDPEITPDGLDLYWAPTVAGRGQLIHHASRPTTKDLFANDSTLAISMGPLNEIFDPAISPDQRVLVFAGQVDMGVPDLFYVTRADSNAAFSTPLEVPGLNTDAREGDGDLTGDGCTLVFSSDRDGQLDIYSTVVRR
jgi:WD40-like Beta Propeller Repeat